MGCTSSAPNMPDFQTNATESTNTDVNERIDAQEKENTHVNNKNHVNSDGQMSTEMLPTCDNLTENVQLLSHNNSSIFSKSPTKCSAKDLMEMTLESDCQENNSAEKLTTFLDVADKIIVDKIIEDQVPQDEPSNETDPKNEGRTNDEQKELDMIEEVGNPDVIITEDFDEVEAVENIQEHESPTQSECSRSTRWEALADIAAELPPTLAVDPVTGQIYSLSK